MSAPPELSPLDVELLRFVASKPDGVTEDEVAIFLRDLGVEAAAQLQRWSSILVALHRM